MNNIFGLIVLYFSNDPWDLGFPNICVQFARQKYKSLIFVMILGNFLGNSVLIIIKLVLSRFVFKVITVQFMAPTKSIVE